ncbi:MAG TPA: hypothetical protein VJ768_04090, partial [Anaerolineales bacterium]|nr:hypothetical protein [Anaerolineales bacterium]
THRRVWERTTRLTYSHYAAKLLDERDPDELAHEVHEHLQEAQLAVQRAWGVSELGRLGDSRPIDLDDRAQLGLSEALGEERFVEIKGEPLTALAEPVLQEVIDELGREALTEVYRQLLLSVISELWVEYLTEMEALRVSIGLEAYAQRDPLVQYKSRAFEMYRELLSDMRIGVVSRMFVFRPRDLSAVQAEARAPEAEEMPEEEIQEVELAQEGVDQDGAEDPGRRRRRRRRKK